MCAADLSRWSGPEAWILSGPKRFSRSRQIYLTCFATVYVPGPIAKSKHAGTEDTEVFSVTSVSLC